MDHRRVITRIAAAALIASVAVLAGCSGPQAASPAKTNAPAAEAPAAPAAPDPGVVPLHVSDTKLQGDEKVVITTPKGVIELTLMPDKAPNTVASFVELVQKGFYDGLKFHRVVPSFVVQGGDPLSRTDDPKTGTGNPGWHLKAEFSDAKHLEGTLAMARSKDPDSAGSQFYITLAPQPSLDGDYTVFGTVVKGMDVVRGIQSGDVITSIKIVHGS